MTYPKLKQLAQKYSIVLGSGSPRRVQLLEELFLPFSQLIPDIDETILAEEQPYQYALRMSHEKGEAIRNQLKDNQLAFTFDTIVILNNEVLGKPEDESEAKVILQKLSGNQHEVATSIAVTSADGIICNDLETTKVYFHSVSEEQIENYIRTKEPMDKAGAYGIQGMGAFLVDRIDGNLDNVIGLPRTLLEEMASQILDKEIS